MSSRTSRLAHVSVATIAMVFVLPLAGFFLFDWFPQPCELLASVGHQGAAAKAVKALFPSAQACGGGSGEGGSPPPPPADPCDPANPSDQCNHYLPDNPIWKWKETVAMAGVPYTIDTDSVPVGITVTQFKQAVDAAFNEWSSYSFINFVRDPNQVVGGESGLCTGCGGIFNDGINSIHFLNRTTPGFTDTKCLLDGNGQCILFKDEAPNDVNRDYKKIIGVDTVLDITPDKPWTTVPAPGTYDLQSTITHEIGHWLYLNDIYGAGESKLTMYGTTVEGSDQKRTLGVGDKLGLNYIYDGGPL